jgi:hypothetical protein
MPGEGFSTAVAVFGITGVGASELFMYPYWCVEKGYARFTGLRDDSPEWDRRARGWIQCHAARYHRLNDHLHPSPTIAFYLLGAGILHGMGKVPAANDMIPVLSNIYTQTLGEWSLWIFYIGAIFTLYGTIFASTASNSRVFADMARLLGFFESGEYQSRVRYRNGFIIAITSIPVIFFLLFKSPVQMIVAGGVAQAMMLPVIGVRKNSIPSSSPPAVFYCSNPEGHGGFMVGYCHHHSANGILRPGSDFESFQTEPIFLFHK